ncbi:MAG: metallophosphoesterase [Clostridia bacterium]|nr:metallophosphoesterase [Clostridia bacterium]
MIKNKSKAIKLIIIFLLLIILSVWIIWGNKALMITEYTVTSDRLPDEFDGFRIAQVSDLHNSEFGRDNSELLDMLKEAEPDIIVITGDLIDSRNVNIDIALNFVKEALKIAPCYYVSGNHEANVPEYQKFKNEMIAFGVHVLENKCVHITASGEKILLIGVDDPLLQKNNGSNDSSGIMKNVLDDLISDHEYYTILLSHRPELFELYSGYNIDLVLSGHAHGGQFRIPFVGGVFAPSQGLFPKYDAGLFYEKGTNMIISRGIGNSAFPLRINNRPEIVVVELNIE